MLLLILHVVLQSSQLPLPCPSMKNPPLQSSVSSCLTTYNKDFDDDDDDDNDVSQRSTTADPQYTPVIHRLAIRR